MSKAKKPAKTKGDKERIGMILSTDLMCRLRTYLFQQSADTGSRCTQSEFIEKVVDRALTKAGV